MLSALLLALQVAAPQQQGGPVPTSQAIAADIRIDGKLDDLAWATTRPVTEFSQTAPHEGERATERTEVRAVESFEHERMTALALATSTQPTMVFVMRMA
jgi:hypothetical protein